ncbi:hypothetical protein FNH05_35500, partial [Amycolatopsis rhizosphaerae]
MQTWAKRGIQTALVTGGLLMLGTGIASADEKVSPDVPAGPLDLNASIPVDISHNAIGTLGRQVNLPEIKTEISTKPVTDVLNKALAPVSQTGALKAAAPVTGAVNEAVAKGTSALPQASGKRVDQAPVQSTGDPLMGNKVVGNIALPIQITGNALGVLGNATVDSASTQTYAHNSDISTSGAGGGLAGNAVNLDWALPVQISGNAGALGGSAKTTGSATQSAAATGNTTTDGTNGAGAGNVVSPQLATPVQLSGNALGWFLGHAQTDFNGSSDATSGGYTATHGSQGSIAGNVAAVPLALPIKASNNAITWGGDADSAGSTTANATAGGTTPGPDGTPAFVQTDGDQSFLAGSIIQPQAAVPATVASNAAAWIGNAVSGKDGSPSALNTTAHAGGFSTTSGKDAAGSGTVADVPVALPAEVFCVGGTWIGNAHASGCENTLQAIAGGRTYTNGNGGFLSGNSASAQPAGTAEVFGVGGSWIGNASGSATENKLVQAGGYNGSQGNDSAGSGNVVQVPVALPAEVFGVGGSWIGQGAGTASETKDVTAGGGGNTQDDNGAASANLVAVPVSLPVQAFGIGGSWIGNGQGSGTTDTTSTAGGHLNANGKKGFLAGNLADVPVSLPTQLHGIGATLVGNGHGASQNTIQSLAGGDATATGEGGSLAGNIIQVPGAAAADVFGTGAIVAGTGSGDATNDVVSSAAGSTHTNGDGGSLAGNVISAPLSPVAQVFGDAVSVLGVSRASGVNSTEITSGGQNTTSGQGGSLSGDIFDVPVAAVAQVFGVAPAVGGVSHAVADNSTTGTLAGTDTTSGPAEALSGLNPVLPVGVVAQVFDIPLGLLGVASSDTTNATDVALAGHEALIDLPISGAELPATGLPSLP